MSMKALNILSLLIFISIFKQWNVEGRGMKIRCCLGFARHRYKSTFKIEYINHFWDHLIKYICRCSNCGPGTRCFFCEYLIAFHLGNWKPDSIPFKEPFIGMFDDIKEKLEADSQYFSQEIILGFFQKTLEGLTNDCKRCKDYQETINVSEYIKQASSRLGAIVGTSNFVSVALEEITKTLELLEKIPPALAVPRKVCYIKSNLTFILFSHVINFRVSTSSLRESGITFSEKMSTCKI